MTIPYRQRWLLRRMDRRLCRSDPHMAAMLAIFARLTTGEAITSIEQADRPDTRVRRCLAWLGTALAGMVAFLAACARWVFRHVAAACAAARRRSGGTTRTAPSASSAARPPAGRGGPGLPPG